MVKNITTDFKKLIKDLMTDLLNTFPEYRDKFTENELEFLKETGDEEKMEIVSDLILCNVIQYCLDFDIPMVDKASFFLEYFIFRKPPTCSHYSILMGLFE